MAEVWKYEVGLDRTLRLPKGAKVLSADHQFGEIFIWILVNPDPTVEHEARKFEVYGTGHTIHGTEELEFIDSVMVNGHRFVFHVFERIEQSD